MRKMYDRFKRFYTSPKTNKRACDGSYQAQGIGKI
jgi:hypothetical protein